MKNVPALSLVDRDAVGEVPELDDELRVALAEVAGAAREGLLAMSVAVGLRVMAEMMESEVTAKVGAKHAKLADRTASRHGTEDGSVVLGSRRVAVRRPRARTAAGTEVTSESYGTFAADDLLGQVVMEHMLAGLATRRHRSANEPVGAAVEAVASAPSQSSVSRRFVAETTKALDVLMGRDLSELAVQRGVPSSGLHGRLLALSAALPVPMPRAQRVRRNHRRRPARPSTRSASQHLHRCALRQLYADGWTNPSKVQS